MPFEITGVKETIRAIGKAKEETGKRIEDGIRDACEMILLKALKYCPMETGALRQSGTIVVTGKGFGCRGSIIFGGEDAHYAIYVHEDLSKYHQPPTQAKFLERASRELRGSITNMIKRKIIGQTTGIEGEEETPL